MPEPGRSMYIVGVFESDGKPGINYRFSTNPHMLFTEYYRIEGDTVITPEHHFPLPFLLNFLHANELISTNEL